MYSEMTPPPSFLGDPGATASKRASSKRKQKIDGSDAPATKRQLRSGKAKSETPRVKLTTNEEAAILTPLVQDAFMKLPPDQLDPEHDQRAQQPQHPAPPVSRRRGKAASKALARAALGPPAAHHACQPQQLAPQPHAPYFPALQPILPRSADHIMPNEYASYQAASDTDLTCFLNQWVPEQQQFAHWDPAPSQPAPGYGLPLGHQSYDYGPPRPANEFPGHYQPHPMCKQTAPGTAARPIILDDTPQPTPTGFGDAQESQVYMASKFSTEDANAWSENKENLGSIRTENGMGPTPSSSSKTANSFWPLQQPVAMGPPPESWHASAITQDPYADMPTPLGYLDQRPGAPPRVLLRHANPAPSEQHASPIPPGPPPPPPVLVDAPPLCPEQADLVDLILKGHNVFYTGSAGCGKSTVLREFVRRLREMGKHVNIVAPTGRAALNVGGTTTWTYAGWTPNSFKLSLDSLMKKAQWSKHVSKRLRTTDVLVIDEISMVENLHFERLNEIMKAARFDPENRGAPFGGCQIVVTGDFCQLPPVKPFGQCMHCGTDFEKRIGLNRQAVYTCPRHGEYADEDKWAFKSRAWQECNFQHRHLTTIHRQNDPVFIRILQKLRLGYQLLDKESSLLMKHPCRASAHEATKLFPLRREAFAVNYAAFNRLIGDTHTYWAHDNFFWHKNRHGNLEQKGERSDYGLPGSPAHPPADQRPLNCLAEHRFEECVQLKKGALVVLLTNLDLQAGLCNGSQGKICGWEDYDPNMLPMCMQRDSGGSMLSKMLGKSKHEPPPKQPQPGQRTIRGDHGGVQEREIKDFIESGCAPIKKWPIVQFHNGIRRTVYAECSITEIGDSEPYSLLSRTQIPLAPAWAMTVHKSQSLTLDRVIVNLDNAFEEGQVYVALSRATNLAGLKIEGSGSFLKAKAMVNNEVAAFLRKNFGAVYGDLEAEAEGAAVKKEKEEPAVAVVEEATPSERS